MKLPQNLTTLFAKAHVVQVTSNDHRAYHQPLRDYLEEEHNGYDEDTIDRCVRAGTVVEIHVCPYTSVGSYKVAAPDLDSALDAAWEAFPSDLMDDVLK